MEVLSSELLTEWLSDNYIEVLGAALGIVYIVLSVRQNILTWPAGIATSFIYVFVFYHQRFYAGMGLQVYYVAISIYGWYFWLKGSRDPQKEGVRVTRITKRQLILAVIVFLICFAGMYLVLDRLTDSPVPFLDSLTTSLSIVATWMLARKILENWLLWIIADIASVGLYVYKSLWPTTILFLVYTSLAVLGYIRWKKSMLKPAA